MITAAEQLSDFSSSSSSSIRNSTSPPLSVWEWPLLRKHSCYYYYTPIHLYIPIHYTPIHLYTILRKITPGLPLTTIHLPHIPTPTSYSTCPPQPTFTLLTYLHPRDTTYHEVHPYLDWLPVPLHTSINLCWCLNHPLHCKLNPVSTTVSSHKFDL